MRAFSLRSVEFESLVIRNSDSFDLSSAQKRVKDYLHDLLELDDGEKQFLKAFENKEYHPEYLFDDSDILSRIQNHPMVNRSVV